MERPFIDYVIMNTNKGKFMVVNRVGRGYCAVERMVNHCDTYEEAYKWAKAYLFAKKIEPLDETEHH